MAIGTISLCYSRHQILTDGVAFADMLWSDRRRFGQNTFLNIASIISAIAAAGVASGNGPLPFCAFAARRYSFAAASSVAMSNFTILIIAAIALECFRISPIFSGTICQHRPNLSVSQPQAMGLPPSSSLSQ
jgi:hypothetical protein